MAAALLVAGGVAVAKSIKCDSLGSCVGTFSADTIWGTRGYDDIEARDGNDTVYARGGKDYLSGGWGSDRLYGNAGNDIFELSGPTQGRDRLYGEAGNDHFYTRTDYYRDIVYAGRGDDYVDVADDWFYSDTVYCGPGKDFVYYDEGVDYVAADCEDGYGF
jgi:Ca2+-binding RTX toxin-like protein